jgi:UDP-GlcNAc:undecaprenyl-phosphate/decaprenyl-phosphate GlcNAc-1-phosphate transferase
MLASVLFFGLGWVIVFALTPSIIRLGLGLDISDAFRKKHDGKISRLGGVPIFTAFLCANGFLWLMGSRSIGMGWGAVVLCTTLMFLLGLWDDLKPLGAKFKLAGQILIALIAFSFDLRIDQLTYPSGNFSLQLGGWSILFTVFWLIAVPNIINLIDGFDGLAGGIGVFLSVTLGVVAFSSEQVAVACLCFAMAGALLAFLFFNFPPAKIFLGDGGAYMVGFLIASLSLQSSNKGSVAAALIVTVVALGLPILDTGLTLFRRGVQGFPLFRADHGHLHHRLQELGFSKTKIVIHLYAVCVVLSLIGLSILWSQGRSLPIVAGMLFLLAVGAARYLGYFSNWYELRMLLHRMLVKRRDVQYGVLLSRVLVMEIEREDDPEAFWKSFYRVLDKVGIRRSPIPGGKNLRLEIRRPSGALITFFADLNEHDENYWRLLTDYYRMACRKADEKWPPTTGAATSPVTDKQ